MIDEYAVAGRYSQFLEDTNSDFLVRIWVEDTKMLLDDMIAKLEFYAKERGVKVTVNYEL